MPFGLREGFTEGGSEVGTASGITAAAAFEGLVNDVLLPQPFTLTGMAGERFELEVEPHRDVEDERTAFLLSKGEGI